MVKLYYHRNQRFSKLKAQCEKDERLFVDPEFPPETKSLYFSRATPPEPVEWKRPKVLVKLFFIAYDFLFNFVPLSRFHFLTYRSKKKKTQELCHDKTKRDFNFTSRNVF